MPGAELDAAIRIELREAAIFIALAGPDYLQSEYCFVKEDGYARKRAARKKMFVVAVILRPCQWKGTKMARYKSLSRDGKEVTRWANRDATFEDVVNGLRKVIAEASALAIPPALGHGKQKAKRTTGKPQRPAAAKAVPTSTSTSKRSIAGAAKIARRTKRPASGSPESAKTTLGTIKTRPGRPRRRPL